MGQTFKTVAVPGSFDPIHSGHIALLKESAKLGMVTVILKGDKRLEKKKGKIFMKAEERKEILAGLRDVDYIYTYDSDLEDHEDFSEALRILKPDILALGDKEESCLEPKYIIDICKELGIEIKYGVGGNIINSSSVLLNNYKNNEKN